MSSEASVQVTHFFNAKSGGRLAGGKDGSQRKYHFPEAVVSSAALTKGGQYLVQAVPPGPHSKSRDWRVIDVKLVPHDHCKWKKWQRTGRGDGLPETEPGQDVQLDFGCYQCGAPLLQPHDIFKIKGGCVWTNGTPAQLERYGSSFRNPAKEVSIFQARCETCHANVGTYYPHAYKDVEDGKVFPCYKLTFRRSTKFDQYYFAQHLVLLGDERRVLSELDRLRQVGSGVAVGERTSTESYAVTAQLRETAQRLEQTTLERDQATSELDQLKQAALEAEEAMGGVQQHWEVKLDSGEWRALPADIGNRLDKGQTLTYSAHGQHYEANPRRQLQRNVVTGKERQMRQTESGLLMPGHELAMMTRTPNRTFRAALAEVQVYDLKHSREAVDMTTDALHFSLAATQFTLMFQGKARPRSVSLWVNPVLKKQYDAKRAEFQSAGKPIEEVWVFHGTGHDVTEQICQDGFKIGGQDVAVAHGTVHGTGVYTATGPLSPMAYNQNRDSNKHVILAKGLLGTRDVDSRAPKADWLVFNTKEQLLPLYVVYYD